MAGYQSTHGSLVMRRALPAKLRRAWRQSVANLSEQDWRRLQLVVQVLAAALLLLILLLGGTARGRAHLHLRVRGGSGRARAGEPTAGQDTGGHPQELPFDNAYARAGGLAELDELLSDLAVNNVIVLTVANSGFRDFVDSFTCQLEQLELRNYLLIALDYALFQLAARRGINVFWFQDDAFWDLAEKESASNADESPKSAGLEANQRDVEHPETVTHETESRDLSIEAPFGSAEFVQISKRKSRVVVQVLILGYDVVFSDVDVAWLAYPLDHMDAYDADIVIQSDILRGSGEQLNFNINSGFYLARANSRSIAAFKAIIKHGNLAHLSEQKSFNHILCGAFKNQLGGPGKRVGNDQCLFTKKGDSASVQVLPDSEFPNGSNEEAWRILFEAHAADNREEPQFFIIHANNFNSTAIKRDVLSRAGLWYERGTDGACTLTG
ncbi:Beta-arabinofuranosyltransferase RAY1 [Porphyridium purpureum]|uniref:Beta-arabinofuranosyltransferase RAY1 n=1 Tax=Porphyridium purpureum TaxID=35688 RepID=A0A5J4YU53_PORPP|nr:Beta-arabinofuranosyltransferase RAY1 [Porphyridium purpureum]|eukprot:POR4392..scf227_4